MKSEEEVTAYLEDIERRYKIHEVNEYSEGGIYYAGILDTLKWVLEEE